MGVGEDPGQFGREAAGNWIEGKVYIGLFGAGAGGVPFQGGAFQGEDCWNFKSWTWDKHKDQWDSVFLDPGLGSSQVRVFFPWPFYPVLWKGRDPTTGSLTLLIHIADMCLLNVHHMLSSYPFLVRIRNKVSVWIKSNSNVPQVSLSARRGR